MLGEDENSMMGSRIGSPTIKRRIRKNKERMGTNILAQGMDAKGIKDNLLTKEEKLEESLYQTGQKIVKANILVDSIFGSLGMPLQGE